MYSRRLKSLIVFWMVLSVLILPVSCVPNLNEPKFNVLPTLKGLKLSGKLVFIALQENGNQLVELDLSSDKTQVLFTGAPRSWLNSAEVSPDGKQIVLAYALPPANNDLNFGFTDLDLLPAGGGKAPTPLLVRFNPNESFFYPTWAPDGKSIYYSHNAQDSTVPSGVKTRIERSIPGSEPQPLIDNAMWPRLSPDGTKIVFHSLKNEDMDNVLFWANADGSSPRQVIQAPQPVIVDAMLFALDGKSIYFSMAQSQAFQQPGPLAKWPHFPFSLGVQPVFAHSIPSDWYRVALAGGHIQQISHLGDFGMFAAFSPDGEWLAVVSQKGIVVMKSDGSQSTQIANIPATGSVNWLR